MTCVLNGSSEHLQQSRIAHSPTPTPGPLLTVAMPAQAAAISSTPSAIVRRMPYLSTATPAAGSSSEAPSWAAEK